MDSATDGEHVTSAPRDRLPPAAHVRHAGAVARRLSSAQDRAADAVTAFSGSMPFVYLHAAWFGVWIVVNAGLLGAGLIFDAYPYGLLTMIVSLEAIFLSTFVLITENRLAARARVRADLEFEADLRAEVWSIAIGRKLGLDPHEIEQDVQALLKADGIVGTESAAGPRADRVTVGSRFASNGQHLVERSPWGRRGFRSAPDAEGHLDRSAHAQARPERAARLREIHDLTEYRGLETLRGQDQQDHAEGTAGDEPVDGPVPLRPEQRDHGVFGAGLGGIVQPPGGGRAVRVELAQQDVVALQAGPRQCARGHPVGSRVGPDPRPHLVAVGGVGALQPVRMVEQGRERQPLVVVPQQPVPAALLPRDVPESFDQGGGEPAVRERFPLAVPAVDGLAECKLVR